MHILTIVILALVFLPGLWVRFVLASHSRNQAHIPGTGGELVTHFTEKFGVKVSLEETTDGDHYDPESKTIRLSHANMEGKSLTAVATAAHEFGHAMQDASGDSMMAIRTSLAKKSARITSMASGLLLLAPILTVLSRSPAVGIALFGIVFLMALLNTALHLATLPLEWDASFGKALPMLESGNYLKQDDLLKIRKILRACALTYVAQSMLGILNFRNLIAVIRR